MYIALLSQGFLCTKLTRYSMVLCHHLSAINFKSIIYYGRAVIIKYILIN
jgi:hypothetical protein